MTDRIFIYVTHKDGVADELASELQVAAKKINPASVVTAVVTGFGQELDQVCASLRGMFAEIWKISNEALCYPNAELVRKALTSVLPPEAIVLLCHSHFGMDLAPGLSVKLNAAAVSDVTAIQGLERNWLKIVRQEFGGQISAHVCCDVSTGAVISIRPGAFKPSEAISANGVVFDKSAAVGAISARRRYLETIVAEPGDVDIGKEAVLVSIGRGIQEEDNVVFAEELAEAMGASVSCSRPVVDAGWLPKSRQVGSSGKTVKPKVYIACGISGSFQHLAGIKGNPFIIAINRNPKAPIFQVADAGVVDDILEFLPELTSRIQELTRAK